MTSRLKCVKVALLSVDPPGLTHFHSFDPDSFAVISAINDGLTYIDVDGSLRPALATSWTSISPTEVEFKLRRGVKFHNGEDFDAACVVATLHAHKHPSPTPTGGTILSPLKAARAVDDYTVRLETEFPDAMLLRRVFFLGVYPKGVLEQHGRDYLAEHPIGTGAYRFVSYERGREIVLERNPDHWAGEASVDCIRLPILRQKEWVDRLQRGELDVLWDLDCHDLLRASRLPGIVAESRQASVSQYFRLANRGVLADDRVRRALNHAINRRLLVDVTEHGMARPQRSIATPEDQGYAECDAYRYSPELARRLLAEAGFSEGFTLRGLVSETSTAVFFTVRELLARVGVTLEAEIVPRSEWFVRIAGGNMSGKPYDGDFAVVLVDNPLLHSLFHQFTSLFSHGNLSLTRDEAYDQVFLRALTTTEPDQARLAQAELERYARDRALLLFTIQTEVHGAWRQGFSCSLPASGHFDAAAFWKLRMEESVSPGAAIPAFKSVDKDANLLLDATSHVGTFFLKPGSSFEEPTLERIWQNISISEQRWRLQNEPMLRELVSQVEAKTSLANVLGSTDRVAIVGYSMEGRQLFVNKGYELMFGGAGQPIFHHLGKRWDVMRSQVDAQGSWLGPVVLDGDGRPAGAPTRLYLSVTRAIDEEALSIGYTFVLSDFSGEEERIRNHAIRDILDNVPYGLFMCDRRGAVLEGYSEACRGLFTNPERGIEGRKLRDLLGMDERMGEHFELAYEQLVDDVLPEAISVRNLPKRVPVGQRTYSLSASLVRAEDGGVSSVLFTLLDITELIEAEREVEVLRGEMQVARFRDSFESFARSFDLSLDALIASADDQALIRRELHTAKGVFGQFNLLALAHQIHDIEDHDPITGDHLRELRHSFRRLLERNLPLWDIRLDDDDSHYMITESTLHQAEARIRACTSQEETLRVALEVIETLRQKTAGDLVGPLQEACSQHAARRGKRVELQLQGSEVRCPRQFEPVFDVLPHLLRNSIDHGVEKPEARGQKAPTATIRVEVSASGDGLDMSVRDDGRGIDVDRVVRRAVELGLTTLDRAHQMSEQERIQLIFVSGLSTAEQITETSGRGFGMAAVKETIESLGGELSVRSRAGEGTLIEMHLRRREASVVPRNRDSRLNTKLTTI